MSGRSTSVNISMGLGWIALVVLILSGTYVWDIRCAWFRIQASCEAAKDDPTGETSDTLGRSIWGAGQARKEGTE